MEATNSINQIAQLTLEFFFEKMLTPLVHFLKNKTVLITGAVTRQSRIRMKDTARRTCNHCSCPSTTDHLQSTRPTKDGATTLVWRYGTCYLWRPQKYYCKTDPTYLSAKNVLRTNMAGNFVQRPVHRRMQSDRGPNCLRHVVHAVVVCFEKELGKNAIVCR